MLKKIISKKEAKSLTKYAAKKEAKIIFGSLVTIGTHKLIQKAARTYPSLSFLKA